MSSKTATNLVLLPGLDGTGILFRSLLSFLPRDIRPKVIVYPPNKSLSISEHAQFVAQHLPDGPLVLLAESFSGLVALALLAEDLPCIKGVLFVASFAEPPRPLLLRLAPLLLSSTAMRLTPSFLLCHFCLGHDAGERELALLREALAVVPPAVLRHRLRIILEHRQRIKAGFQIPCYYLRASHDRLVPSAAAKWFPQNFSTCQVESLEGPHFLLQAKPRQCAAWVTEKLGCF